MSMKKKQYISPEWELLEVELEVSVLSNEQIDNGEEDDYGEF